ncbi:MAG: hypothetical protein GY947_01070 [Rhodobacteraceae bacterium]|nr:hypothetical protein [Paracoccaceae bacterium]
MRFCIVSDETKTAVARVYNEVLNNHRVVLIPRLYHEDFIGGDPANPFDMRRHSDVEQLIEAYHATISDHQNHNRDYSIFLAISDKDSGGLPPTGAGNHHPDGTQANHALTFEPDHSGGADQKSVPTCTIAVISGQLQYKAHDQIRSYFFAATIGRHYGASGAPFSVR